MDLVFAAPDPSAYLGASEAVDLEHPRVVALIERIRSQAEGEVERARLVFELCRDEVRHSFDLEGARVVPCRASEVAEQGEGICFAKANLCVALLRGLGIPAGFCYQRLVYREGTHVLHGLVAVYLGTLLRWIRLEPRGNKPGVDAQFSLAEERLAYRIDPAAGEIDYPEVYPEPASIVLAALRGSSNTRELAERLPTELARG